ncbi:flavin-containing monooxygenase [Nocardioides acrostichi]|uniref:NAD(P)/FAD-dependent oxidoreductase n=1 Tax=Nocardioides acrostichi TaxID=2784339 RepID=A0A930V1C5_9ACTN|nr:NAD(P)/FAD-dependent oxidoreductase [Nocardioides acrostichi]MBF4161419.1 NAD(P)/FAD-dependent oxidoreductase [Nocardioides acrostichi]
MKIAIVGAGFAGISSAKVLTELGHDVTVYEKTPDIGGVWSTTRRYPGLKTQNNKGTYCLSDLKMPGDYPEWPSGEQVAAYLASYAEKFGLTDKIRLDTEVTIAEPAAGGGWSVVTALGAEHVDHLVLASGIFSRPFVPPVEGIEEFEQAGGQYLPASEFHSLEQVRGKHTVVLGYGKSACDITVEIAKQAASTTVVARELLWKMPRKIKGVLNYKYLMLTRMGEGLFRYRALNGAERLLHANDSKIASGMLGSVEGVTTKQLGLQDLDLVPQGTFSDIAKSTVSLATEGFFEGVASKRITVHRDTVISRFVEKDGAPHAELANGEVIRADVVIAATGWTQDIPFLPAEVLEKLLDANGDFLLYRQIHPIQVPDLSFAGYNSSFFSPLSAEVSALWIGSFLGGHHTPPPTEEMLRQTRERLAWMRERTGGMHARGTNIIPFSMHNVDEVLGDIGLDVPRRTKAKQWLLPVKPADYRRLTPKLAKRLAAAR